MGRAVGRVAPFVLFGLIPIVFLLGALLVYWDIDEFALDFHYGLYPQAHRLLSDGVPFDSPDAAITGHNAIYTTFTAAVATPITLLPPLVADIVFTALLVAAGAACLWVLGVRDWRVYGVVAMWAPVISARADGERDARPRVADGPRLEVPGPAISARSLRRACDRREALPVAARRLARSVASLRGLGGGARGHGAVTAC